MQLSTATAAEGHALHPLLFRNAADAVRGAARHAPGAVC